MTPWLRMSLFAVLLFLAVSSARADQRLFDEWFLRGDTSRAVAHIESGGDPEIRDKEGMTLLNWAAWRGDIRIAQMLLDRGVDVDILAPGDITSLMHASHAGHPEMVAFLLSKGANPLLTTDKEFAALHFWALDGHPDTLTHLLDADSDPLGRANMPDRPGHQFLPLDGVRKKNPWVLNTDPGRRLLRLTYEGTGCEGVIVLASDSPLSVLAERTLGKASRWKEIAKLNGLGADKSYQLGDCLKLPVR